MARKITMCKFRADIRCGPSVPAIPGLVYLSLIFYASNHPPPQPPPTHKRARQRTFLINSSFLWRRMFFCNNKAPLLIFLLEFLLLPISPPSSSCAFCAARGRGGGGRDAGEKEEVVPCTHILIIKSNGFCFLLLFHAHRTSRVVGCSGSVVIIIAPAVIPAKINEELIRMIRPAATQVNTQSQGSVGCRILSPHPIFPPSPPLPRF